MAEPKGKSWESMTGFAVSEAAWLQSTYRFQLKSVNHRYFEFRMRAPREFFAMEVDFKQKFRETLKRGSVELLIERVDRRSTQESDPFIQMLPNLKKRFETAIKTFAATESQAAVLLRALMERENTSQPAESVDAKAQEAFLVKISSELSTALLSLRRREGGEIQCALAKERDVLAKSRDKFRETLPTLQKQWREDIDLRIRNLAENLGIKSPESDKIYQEFVLIMERRDVAEELQRIDAHIDALGAMIEDGATENIGKRLDFLAQELHREWTTLNNKVSDTSMSPIVADAKLAIDRIREQSLNLL